MKIARWMEWLSLILLMTNLVIGFYGYNMSFGWLVFFDIWIKKRNCVVLLMILCLISGLFFMMIKTEEDSCHAALLWMLECEWYLILLLVLCGILTQNIWTGLLLVVLGLLLSTGFIYLKLNTNA